MEATINNKARLFRVNTKTGLAFEASANLLGIDKRILLEKLMQSYVSSIQCSIKEVEHKYPTFDDQYPFVANPKE